MFLRSECAENVLCSEGQSLFVSEKLRPQVYEGMVQNLAEDPHVYASLAKNRNTTADSPYQNTVSKVDHSNGYVKVIAGTEQEMMEKSNQPEIPTVPAYVRMDASV